MPEGYDLGSAFGRIVIDTSSVKASMDQARGFFQNGLQGIGSGIQSIGNQMSSLGSSLTTLTAPVTAFGIAGVKAAMDFDSALAEIQARTGATTESMEAIRAKALQIGQDTIFSAGQAGEAFLQLLTTGQSLEEAMATIDAVMAGAAASGADLGFTADALTDIMAMFSLEADQAGVTMDALAQASGVSSATMQDLVMGFQNVGGVAKQFGLSVDETAAILATFSENGIKGSEAGTQLRSMLNNMTRDTADVTGMWNQLGISMFDAQGQARPLATVMDELRGKLEGMSDAERIETLRTLGGQFGQLGLAALTSGDGFDVMLEKMEGAATATDVADARMNTFKGSLLFMKGSLETLMIKGFTPFMNNTLKPLVQRMAQVINTISLWIDANPELAQTIIKVVAAVAALGPTLLAAGKALGAIGTIITTLSSPFGLLIGAISGLAWAFKTNFLGIRDFVQPILDAVSEGISRFIETLQSGGSLGDAIGAAFGGDGLGSGISGFLTGLADGVQKAGEVIGQFVAWLTGEALPAVGNFIETQIWPIIQRFVNGLASIWEQVRPALESLWNWFTSEGLPMIGDLVSSLWNDIIKPAFDFLAGVWEMVAPALGAIAAWFISEGLPLLADALNTAYENIIKPVFQFLFDLWTQIQPAVSSLLDWFVNTGWPVITQLINDAWNNVIKPAIQTLSGIWEAVSGAFVSLLGWFTKDGWPVIRGAIEDVWHNVIEPLINVLATIWDVLQAPFDLLKGGIEEVFSFLTGIVEGFIELVKGIVGVVEDVAGVVEDVFTANADRGRRMAQSVSSRIDWSQATQSQDSGGQGVAGMPYLIGKGAQPELFVPQTNGTFIPNADQLMGGAGGDTWTFGDVVIQMPAEALRDPAMAQRRGGEFAQAFMEKVRERGG